MSAIIDNHNKFIQITFQIDKLKICWKDSYRIFPVSLYNLCKNFGVEGKLFKYNKNFNNVELFKNTDLLEEFKQYSLQDSISLLKALINARIIYIEDHSVDITSILSTSTFYLKIFRSKYLKFNIPIIRGLNDRFIRCGYFGRSNWLL